MVKLFVRFKAELKIVVLKCFISKVGFNRRKTTVYLASLRWESKKKYNLLILKTFTKRRQFSAMLVVYIT